jgi:hypothetical protein
LNPNENVQILGAGTVVGNLTEVTVISQVLNDNGDSMLDRELGKLLEKYSRTLSKEQSKQVSELLLEFKELFAVSDSDLGHTDRVKHKIETGASRPLKQPPRRTPVSLREEVDKDVENMLEKGIIEPADGHWSSGIVLVKKKDGTTRFCVDYRSLNACTIKDACPLPRIDYSLEQLSGHKWFSTLDLCSGYWQVEIEESDRPKTAFATRKGLYQFRRMPFGLANAPATFERLMENVLAGLQWDIRLIYLDDIIVMGKTFEEMIGNLRKVFQKLKGAGLKFKPKKCTLFAKEVAFLDQKSCP